MSKHRKEGKTDGDKCSWEGERKEGMGELWNTKNELKGY